MFYSKTSVEDFKRQTLSSPEFWPHFLDNAENSKGVTRKQTRGMSYRNLRHQDSFKNSPSLIPLASSGRFNNMNLGAQGRKNSLKPAMFVVTKEASENVHTNGDLLNFNEPILDMRDSYNKNRFESREFNNGLGNRNMQMINERSSNDEENTDRNGRFKKKY